MIGRYLRWAALLVRRRRASNKRVAVWVAVFILTLSFGIYRTFHTSTGVPERRCGLGVQHEDGSNSAGSRQFYLIDGVKVPRISLPEHLRFDGRGIVLAATGKIPIQEKGVYITCYLLRKVLGSIVPIEVFYVGEEEALRPSIVKALMSLGDIQVIDLLSRLQSDTFYRDQLPFLHVPDESLRSYAAKPYAVYASRFAEVALLDAGLILFVDPFALLGSSSSSNDSSDHSDSNGSTRSSTNSYSQSGLQIFRDYRELVKGNWENVKEAFCADVDLIIRETGGAELDSSCILINKVTNWETLLLVLAMNGPLQRHTYSWLNGDKDTWVLSSIVANQSFTTSDTTPGYLMVGAEESFAGLHPDYLGKAEPLRGHVQFLREGGGVRPLYLNNQVLSFLTYPVTRQRLYFGLWREFGYPFCGWRPARRKVEEGVLKILDAVMVALRELGEEGECLCKANMRCRWPFPSHPDWPFKIFPWIEPH